MKISNIDMFLKQFFSAHHCPILYHDNGVLTVQLTEKLDKALMNRPFYWHYIKGIGQQGEPMSLTLITNPEKREIKGEAVHFGSPRLQQIFNYVKEQEQYTKLFEVIDTTKNTPLYPWLVTNIKISYTGKHKRDEIYSIGLNLVNGKMESGMMDLLENIQLQLTISDYCYTISPLIKLPSGFKRIEAVIENFLTNQQHEWAQESIEVLESEINLLKHFYNQDSVEETEQMQKEIEEIIDRYTPKITIKVINGGIFYLSDTV